MVLGDYHPATTTDEEDEDIERMKFIERSIRLELDYIRRLRKSLKDPDRVVLSNINITATTTTKKKKTPVKDAVVEVVIDAIREATWPSIATSSTNSSTTTKAYYDMTTSLNTTTNPEKPDEVYDYDWASIYGFGNMHEEWNCRKHAHSQSKPIYTPEMWDMLWNTFVESTLFPFPVPAEAKLCTQTNHQSCPEQPFNVQITTDGKGRGNFAARNITKGEQIYNGHPNTVFFPDRSSFNRFITSLPREVACDVLEWAWQQVRCCVLQWILCYRHTFLRLFYIPTLTLSLQDLTNSGNVVLCLNLDNAVFFNHGTWDNVRRDCLMCMCS